MGMCINDKERFLVWQEYLQFCEKQERSYPNDAGPFDWAFINCRNLYQQKITELENKLKIAEEALEKYCPETGIGLDVFDYIKTDGSNCEFDWDNFGKYAVRALAKIREE